MQILKTFKGLILTALVSTTYADLPKGMEQVIFTWTDRPDTTLNASWLLPDDHTAEFKWRKAGSRTWQQSTIQRHTFAEAIQADACQVQLSELQPNTTYEIQLSERNFRVQTLPKKRPERVSFVVGGDMMHTPELHTLGTQAMAARNPDFAILGGDLAYANGKSPARWLDWLDIWAEQAVREDGTSIAAIVAIGNHEVNGGYGKTPAEAPFFYSLFTFPQALTAHYTVDLYKDLSLIVLDSNHTKTVPAQKEWLEAELQTRQDHTHLFAVYHFPAYGIMKKGLEARLSHDIRTYWTPLFDQYGLDAALENDHHIYKRSHLLKDGEVDDTGTLYIGDGAWGVHTRKIPEYDDWYVAHAESTNHVIEIVIEDDVRTYNAINHQQAVFDHYTDARDQTPKMVPHWKRNPRLSNRR